MAYFDPFGPISTGLLFLNWILWWETKAKWKKLSIILDGKFSINMAYFDPFCPIFPGYFLFELDFVVGNQSHMGKA